MLIFCVNPTEPVSLISTPWDLALAHPEAIRCYYRDIDVTLIQENLKLTPAERLQKLEEFVSFITSLRRAERRSTTLG